MARKRKPVPQKEQPRRFIEAAREAGVEADDSVLENIVRKKTMTFTAPTEEEARKRLAEWRRSNPNATIIFEHKSVLTTALPTASPKQSKQLVSIVIEFRE